MSKGETQLIEDLKNKLNSQGYFPSKSEIVKAGLQSLKKMSKEELANNLKDLMKVKKTRLL